MEMHYPNYCLPLLTGAEQSRVGEDLIFQGRNEQIRELWKYEKIY
jgi:hypothetical protein